MGELTKQLSEREREILLKVAELYIKEGEPVGSRTLQKTYRLPYSPATIRNVMADLEDLGLLYQPHTSAGRIPTDEGLKIYINSLFLALGEQDETLLNRLLDYLKSENITDRDEILAKVLDFLKSSTGYVGFGVNLVENLTVESITLVKVASEKVLMVINFQPDYVLHKVIKSTLQEPELQKLSKALTQKFKGKTLKEVKKELLKEIDLLRKEISELYFQLNAQILKTLNEVNRLEIQGTANLVNVVADDLQKMKQVLEILEEKNTFLQILKQFLEEGKQVSVILGSETEVEPLAPFSFVLSKYKNGARNSGVIGIIGPKRMDYTNTIPLVETVAKALSKLLEEK